MELQTTSLAPHRRLQSPSFARITAAILATLITALATAPTSLAAPLVKSPHFVSASTGHGKALAAAPSHVTLRFDFDVARGSTITVRRRGKKVNGSTSIARGDLGLQTRLNTKAPGRYEVTYTPCWPDGSCHKGHFHFTVRAM